MPAAKVTVPINVNVYLPKTTFNPYIRNAVSYANLGTATLTENASLSSPNSISDSLAVGTWTDLPGSTTSMSYKPLSGSLANGEEHEVFTLVFTANTGFHFDSGGKSLVKTRILTNAPNKARNFKDLKSDSEQLVENNYANRWRFVETSSNFDSNNLAKTVTIVAHYTAPDYRHQDARQIDGITLATNASELAKNRGILVVPMLRKSTTALTSKIDSLAISNTFVENAFGDDGLLTIYRSKTKNKTKALIQGVSGATGTLNISQISGLEFDIVSEDFTIAANGRAVIPFTLPSLTADEFQVFIESSATMSSSIPTSSSPKSIFKFDDVTLKIQATQTGSSFHGSSPGFTAATVIKGAALTTVNKPRLGALGTVSANHASLNKEKQFDGALFAFSLQINPLASGGSDDLVVIDTGIGDGGFLRTFTLTNGDKQDNGGTIATLRRVKLVQSSANVLIVGYVHVKRLGKSDVTLQLPIDDFLTVS
jgi:hypothetical protein